MGGTAGSGAPRRGGCVVASRWSCGAGSTAESASSRPLIQRCRWKNAGGNTSNRWPMVWPRQLLPWWCWKTCIGPTRSRSGCSNIFRGRSVTRRSPAGDLPRQRVGDDVARRAAAGVRVGPARRARRRGRCVSWSAPRFLTRQMVSTRSSCAPGPAAIRCSSGSVLRSPGGSGLIGEVLDVRWTDSTPTPGMRWRSQRWPAPGRRCRCWPWPAPAPPTSLPAVSNRQFTRGVLEQVSASGVRFHHALLAEAAGRLGRCSESVPPTGLGVADGRRTRRASCGGSAPDAGRRRYAGRPIPFSPFVRLRPNWSPPATSRGPQVCCGRPTRGAEFVEDVVETGELRANVALDLADVLSWLGDLDPALTLYEQAAELARGGSDPVTGARAEVGANLFANAFVPDLPRMRRLENALENLPAEELHLRATLLSRLAIVGGADVDATDVSGYGPRKRSRWPGPPVIPS